MKILSLFYIVLLCSFLQFLSTQTIKVSQRNLKNSLKKHKNLLIVFYDESCDACIQFLSEFRQAIHILKSRVPELKFAEVNMAQNREFRRRENITYVPALKFFQYGKKSIHLHLHRNNQIHNYFLKEFKKSIEKLENNEGIKDFLKQNQATLIFLKQDQSTSEENVEVFKQFENFYHQYRDLRLGFAQIENQNLMRILRFPTQVQIVMYQYWKDNVEEFHQKLTTENLSRFCRLHGRPLVEEISYPLMAEVFHDKKSIVFLFKRRAGEEMGENEVIFERLARNHRVKNINLIFAKNIMRSEHEQQVAEILGIDETMLPTICIIKPKNSQSFEKFLFQGEVVLYNEVNNFIHEYLEGKLEPYHKTEQLPDEYEQENAVIKKVVRQNWNMIVGDQSKDVLLEIYQPSCEFCEEVETLLTQVANHLKDIKDLTIGRINLSTNDFSDLAGNIQINQVPTIVFFPKDDKLNPRRFRNDITYKNILNFLKHHITVDYTGSILDKKHHDQQENLDERRHTDL